MFEKLGFLLLGWLLGLLAPVIVDAIKRKRENDLGRVAINTELRILQGRLVAAMHTIEQHLGDLNRVKIEWYVGRYKSLDTQPTYQELATSLKQLLQLEDGAFDKALRSRQSTDETGLTLQKYKTPLLDGRFSSLWSFTVKDQRRLLEIRASLEMLDDIVDRARNYSDMTFKELGLNHQLVNENVTSCYRNYVMRAKTVVELIDDHDFR